MGLITWAAADPALAAQGGPDGPPWLLAVFLCVFVLVGIYVFMQVMKQGKR